MSTEKAPVCARNLSDRAVLEKQVGKLKKASNDADLDSMILLRFSLEGQLVTLNGFIARTPSQLVVERCERQWEEPNDWEFH